MFKNQTDSGSCRVCSSAQRTAKNLRFVSQILGREGLVTEVFSASRSVNCESLQSEWKEWTARMLTKVYAEKRFVLVNAIKGTKTLFDEPCSQVDNRKNCDVLAGRKAVEDWCAKALNRGPDRPGASRVTDPSVLKDIKRRTRRIMGRGWFRERDGVYVPDQQGCYEMERGFGGTLSVPTFDPNGDWEEKGFRAFDLLGIPEDSRHGYNAALLNCAIPEDEKRAAFCRVGCAKQKGKLRVVTMQTSIMKEVLRPVHESAYDRLSRRPWLVRGSVTDAHFESLRSALHKGHDYISGDYESSTDNLHADAVLAVVETLAEELPPRERDLFVRSFRDCAVSSTVNFQRVDYPVVRGSMMGNLGSFVVLCLLNRICYERALNLCGYPRDHPVLINGDDILFPGESGLYHSWLHSTSEVGFVINRLKTMRSPKYGDLNSQTYHYGKSRMVKKLCFGFLGSDSWKCPVGSLVTPLFELCKQLSFGTSVWTLFSFPIRKLFARVPSSLPSIPRRWWGLLIKRSWFRGLVDSASEPEVKTVGVERALPFVLGPPIHSNPGLEWKIKLMGNRVIARSVSEWKGVPVQPRKSKILHRTVTKVRSIFRLGRRVGSWRRLWLAPVLDYLTCNMPHLFVGGNPDWVDDQPGLCADILVTRTPIRSPLSFAPPVRYSNRGLVYQSESVPELTIDGTVLVWQ
nr:MAG: hypothetical protein [Botourmiaviridae sp.]